jgi:hypothetical protein
VVGPRSPVPAPDVVGLESGKNGTVQAIIKLPSVVFQASFVKRIMKELKLRSRAAAVRHLRRFSYFVVTYRPVGVAPVRASTLAPTVEAATNSRSKKSRLSIRKNRIALRGLRNGQQYQVSYQIILKGKKEYKTGTSAPTVFTATRP